MEKYKKVFNFINKRQNELFELTKKETHNLNKTKETYIELVDHIESDTGLVSDELLKVVRELKMIKLKLLEIMEEQKQLKELYNIFISLEYKKV